MKIVEGVEVMLAVVLYCVVVSLAVGDRVVGRYAKVGLRGGGGGGVVVVDCMTLVRVLHCCTKT
ncbi:hypothetical protein IWX49DRAFT_565903 [Phyllosticta citricarpa]